MFQSRLKDVVFLEKAGAFSGLAAFLAALEVSLFLRKIYSKGNL